MALVTNHGATPLLPTLLLMLLLLSPGATTVNAKALWASTPATFADVIRQAYPVGNGKLGGESVFPLSLVSSPQSDFRLFRATHVPLLSISLTNSLI